MAWQDKIRDPDCTLCPLHEDAEYVCLMGSGKKKSQIMVIGEAPGEREDEEHRAFVGPAGQLLTELLAEVGIERADCVITNVAKCRPPENRSPTRAEVKTCVSNYLIHELRVVQPEWVLLLGNAALQGVTRRSGITKHRGSQYALAGGATAFATFHPAYALRSPNHLPTLRADLARFARLVRGDDAPAGKTKVQIVRTVPALRAAIKLLMSAEVISWDIETSSLEEWHGEDSKIVSIGFSIEAGKAVVIPIHHADKVWRDPDRVLGALKPCFERTDAKYVAHNGKFDTRWMAAKGIFVRQDFDTMLAAHLLDENRPKGLKPLSQILLGADAYDIGEDVKDAYNADLRKLCIYNGKDTDYTLRLYHLFREELKKEPRTARVFVKLMMPASNALTRVELVGPWIDPVRYNERLLEVKRRHVKTIKRLHRRAGAPRGINFNSPQQVARWLFRDLGLPIITETKNGNPSTNGSTIKQLAQEFPEVRLLLDYRKTAKYISTYFGNWANVDRHNRYHAGYKLFGTVTGRLSGDFQQVPRDPYMRSIVGAPPGWKFVEADYSQIELRIAAMLARENRMLRLFALGEDIHLATAVAVSGKLPDQITKEERKKAKAVNFGFLYGMGYRKFMEYARDNYEVVVSEEEAKAYRDRFFETYPALYPWHERQRRLVRRYQRVYSPIGRIRHLPDVLSNNPQVQSEAERQAINSPVQSLASDFMLMSIVRLSAILPARDARIVGTVHDSGLFEIRESKVSEYVPLIRHEMEDMGTMKRKFGLNVTVPISVDIAIRQHWGED